MKTYTINKVFDSQKDCDEWERENLGSERLMYNGEYVMMVMHEAMAGADKVMLTQIITV